MSMKLDARIHAHFTMLNGSKINGRARLLPSLRRHSSAWDIKGTKSATHKDRWYAFLPTHSQSVNENDCRREITLTNCRAPKRDPLGVLSADEFETTLGRCQKDRSWFELVPTPNSSATLSLVCVSCNAEGGFGCGSTRSLSACPPP